MGNKGFVPVLLACFLAGAGLMIGASNLHKQQRIEKQKTAEGLAEYPLVQNLPDHSYKPFQ